MILLHHFNNDGISVNNDIAEEDDTYLLPLFSID